MPQTQTFPTQRLSVDGMCNALTHSGLIDVKVFWPKTEDFRQVRGRLLGVKLNKGNRDSGGRHYNYTLMLDIVAVANDNGVLVPLKAEKPEWFPVRLAHKQ